MRLYALHLLIPPDCHCTTVVTSAGAARLSSSEFSREDLLQYARSYGIISFVEGQTLSKAELVKVIAELSMVRMCTVPKNFGS